MCYIINIVGRGLSSHWVVVFVGVGNECYCRNKPGQCIHGVVVLLCSQFMLCVYANVGGESELILVLTKPDLPTLTVSPFHSFSQFHCETHDFRYHGSGFKSYGFKALP